MKPKLTTKKIIITGTHTTPAIELIRQLKSDKKTNWDITYIGRKYNSSVSTSLSIESQIIPNLNVKYFGILCGKLDRRWLPNTLAGIPDILKGFYQAFKLISKIRPNIIVSFGGYVSVPVIISGWLKRIPSITHEQTSTNSLTTKINSIFVSKIALSFKNSDQIKRLPKTKTCITGNLLRHEIFQSENSDLKHKIIINNKQKVVYITAGNQGSHSINVLATQIFPQLKNYIFIHQTGPNDFKAIKETTKNFKNYYVFEYIGLQDIGWIFKNANILISRSGANTSQEIVALNKKSILIPLPHSQQHEQIKNAFWVKSQLPKDTVIIEQDNLSSANILKSIQILLSSQEQSNDSVPEPNFKLLNLIYEII